MAEKVEHISGDSRFTQLANDISDAMSKALGAGLKTDEAACVAVQVAADYARLEYGNAYLPGLAAIVIASGDRKPPQDAATLPPSSQAQH